METWSWSYNHFSHQKHPNQISIRWSKVISGLTFANPDWSLKGCQLWSVFILEHRHKMTKLKFHHSHIIIRGQIHCMQGHTSLSTYRAHIPQCSDLDHFYSVLSIQSVGENHKVPLLSFQCKFNRHFPVIFHKLFLL